jgi:hypothetical protein
VLVAVRAASEPCELVQLLQAIATQRAMQGALRVVQLWACTKRRPFISVLRFEELRNHFLECVNTFSGATVSSQQISS